MKGKSQQDRYALISVFDKTGIVSFARILVGLDYKIISTGGTASVLSDNGIPVVPIQKITGNPESFDGRMKTISFQIESGILFDRTKKTHVSQAKALHIPSIDIVVCNLYPFEQTVAKSGTTEDEIIEQIDVGGPTMVRAAAKNFKSVLVVVDPSDYERVSEVLVSASPTQAFRQELAAKAFGHLSFYDAQIARFLRTDPYPDEIVLPGRKMVRLRYGENPHQSDAYIYTEPGTDAPIQHLNRLFGRELSYVNVTDIMAGIESVRLFGEPAAVVIKHNSPCGIALGETPKQAIERAIAADLVSAFGGVIVLNTKLDTDAASMISSFKDDRHGLIDIVAAPSIDEEAVTLLSRVRRSTGLYVFGSVPQQRFNRTHVRFVDGGFLLQQWDDDIDISFGDWTCVTTKKTSRSQMKQLQIAWKFLTRIRSNAVIVVDRSIPMTRGIGTGQTSRVFSAEIALKQAGAYTKGGLLASDSFFPFDDCVRLAEAAGIRTIIQQGGSVNDQASIDAANTAGIQMIFTHRRAFSH